VTKFLISISATIIYFMIIIPASVLLRVINKKIIPLRFELSKDSYWIMKKTTKPSKK
tara:strand:+ start:186 stop:356 length:171 start_codon:yes stop_codon:yes gene_type:complete